MPLPDRIDLSTQPIELGASLLFKFPSKSRPGKFHLTGLVPTPDGVQHHCSCEGFSFNQTCWHVDTCKERYGG